MVYRFKNSPDFNYQKKKQKKKLIQKWLSKFVVLSIMGISIYLIFYSLWNHLTFDTFFMVKKVKIINNYIAEDHIFDPIRSEVGRNLWHFKDSAYREELLQNPWIKDVTIFKHYPNRIKLKVEEEEPIFFTYEEKRNKWYGYTKMGEKLDWPEETPLLVDLPIIEKIYNLDTTELIDFIYFLEKVKELDEMIYSNVSQIVIEKPDEIKIWMNDFSVFFIFALDLNFKKVVYFWQSLLHKGTVFYTGYKYLDLRVDGYGYLK